MLDRGLVGGEDPVLGGEGLEGGHLVHLLGSDVLEVVLGDEELALVEAATEVGVGDELGGGGSEDVLVLGKGNIWSGLFVDDSGYGFVQRVEC